MTLPRRVSECRQEAPSQECWGLTWLRGPRPGNTGLKAEGEAWTSWFIGQAGLNQSVLLWESEAGRRRGKLPVSSGRWQRE